MPTYVSGGYGGATGMTSLRPANASISREFILWARACCMIETGQLMSHPRGPGPSNYSGDPLVWDNKAIFKRGAKATIVEYLLEADGGVRPRSCAPPVQAPSDNRAVCALARLRQPQTRHGGQPVLYMKPAALTWRPVQPSPPSGRPCAMAAWPTRRPLQRGTSPSSAARPRATCLVHRSQGERRNRLHPQCRHTLHGEHLPGPG